MMKFRHPSLLPPGHAAVAAELKAVTARLARRLMADSRADVRLLAFLLSLPLLCAVAVRPFGLRLLSDLFDVAFLLSLAGWAAVAWQRRREAAPARRPRRRG
jgi:hypothetical protein